MAARVVVVYFSRLGAPLRAHEKAILDASAQRIAELTGWTFAGDCHGRFESPQQIFYVPDDTLLTDELSALGIRSESDVFGGVVPYPFAKTKAVTHSLVDSRAERPDGWSESFARRVRSVVLPGYTAFSLRDIRAGAKRMLSQGPLRLKKALACGGGGQRVATTAHQVEAFVEAIPREEITQFGIVLEAELRDVSTYSVGHIKVGDIAIAYHGIQQTATAPGGRSVYGGSRLVCVRGGWEALDALQMPEATRLLVTKARSYDLATREYPGFMASRRNPPDAVIDFCGEDPIDGPVLRYTRIQSQSF